MKKLTAKSLRQGQTIYYVYIDHATQTFKEKTIFKVKQAMLYSKKVLLPAEGVVIDKLPVNYARKIIAKLGAADYFYSRRKAEALVKLLNR